MVYLLYKTVKTRKIATAVIPIYREPFEGPDFGIWVDRYGRIIDGDEGLTELFGDAKHCFQAVAEESYCRAVRLFCDFVQNGRAYTNTLIRAVKTNGDVATIIVRAELVAHTHDDLWIAIHGWILDEHIIGNVVERLRK